MGKVLLLCFVLLLSLLCVAALLPVRQKGQWTSYRPYALFPEYSQSKLVLYSKGEKEQILGNEHEQPSPPQRKLFYSQKSFDDLGLSDKLIEVLSSLNIQQPSKIQAISFYGINSGKHCIIADQTGSGKTFAYLLPCVQRMLEARKTETAAEKASGTTQSNKSPFIVVMTPTTELTIQVAKNVKSLANALKFRTACFTSMSDLDSEKKKLRMGADVVVCTPGGMLQLLKRNEIDLSNLQVMVLDEVDVLLMDQSFPLKPIGESCPLHTQFLFTTATLPEEVTEQIKTEFPDVMSLKGPGLHRVAPNVDEVLIDCSGAKRQERSMDRILRNKRSALLKVLDSVAAERTIIFCNTIDQCRRVENMLNREARGQRFRSVYGYHGAIDASVRENNLKEFSRPLLKKPCVLICTDRASRGMDFNKAHVDHVILFDFPKEPSEYLRRVGRTGRAGRPGIATILAYGRQVEVARAVMRASIEGKRIEPAAS